MSKLRLKIKGNTIREEFQAQMLGGKSQKEAITISLNQKRKTPVNKISMPTRGHKFGKKKGLNL